MLTFRLHMEFGPRSCDEAAAVLRSLVGPVRAEPGCSATRVLRDTGDDCHLTWTEEWSSAEHFDQHLRGAAFRQIVAVIEMAVAPPAVEIDDVTPKPKMQSSRDEKYKPSGDETYCPRLFVLLIRKNNYSHDEERGEIRNVLFKNISVTGKLTPGSYFVGYDPEHGVSDVTIENLRINGKPISNAAEAQLSIRDHVSKVSFTDTTDK